MIAMTVGLGLAESRLASLWLLGRGKKHVRGGRLNEVCQIRWISWRKKQNYGDERSKGRLTADDQQRHGRKSKDREAPQGTSENPGIPGWGLDVGRRQHSKKLKKIDEKAILFESVQRTQVAARQKDWSLDLYEQHDALEEAEREALSGFDEESEPHDLDLLQLPEGDCWQSAEGRDTLQDAEDELLPEEASQVSSQTFPSESPQPSKPASGAQSVPFDLLLDLDYHAELPIAIKDHDWDAVAQCILAIYYRADIKFIRSMSDEAFTEILQALKPLSQVLENYAALERVTPAATRNLRLKYVRILDKNYTEIMQTVAMLRRESGHRLTAQQYRIMLKHAGIIGLPSLAGTLWQDLLEDGIVPDVSMYNGFLASAVWAGHRDRHSRSRERVISRNQNPRREEHRPWFFGNYTVGPGGIKEQAMGILDSMLKNGVTANEETYCWLMVAAAKEGEIDTVESILTRVWNIDVRKLMQTDPGEEETLNPRQWLEDSSHRPTERFMHTLAYAYSINSDMPTALRLVDYVAGEYDIAISDRVWDVLFEYTCILASHRHGPAAVNDEAKGQLPKRSVQTLWSTMTSEPYNVKPRMWMYNLMMRNLLLQRRKTSEMMEKMEESLALYKEHQEAAYKAWDEVKICTDACRSGSRPWKSALEARRRWELASLERHLSKRTMMRWMRFVCMSFEHHVRRDGSIQDELLDIMYRKVPRMLWDWRKLLGRVFKYDTTTGVVELELMTEDEWWMNQLRIEKVAKRIRKVLSRIPAGGYSMFSDPVTMSLVGGETRALRERREKGLLESQESWRLEDMLEEERSNELNAALPNSHMRQQAGV